jgi:SH3 domain-containing YSC84-like protein 1
LNTHSAVDAFSRGGNITLGGDLSVAAGPVGRSVEAGITPFAAIYSYSRSQGLFAGVSLEGTVIATRNKANRRFYEKNVTTRELLSGKVPPPESANQLYQLLKPYSKR